jgi:UrcA family protein
MTTLSKILAALAAGALLVQPAMAQPGRETVSVEFRYQAWESPAENYQRLHREVKRACDAPGLKLMITRVTEAQCVAGMTDRAVERLGRAELAGVHLAETGRSVGTEFAAR